MWELGAFTFPLPSQPLVAAVAALPAGALAVGGINEVLGRHMKYSKFAESGKSQGARVPSRVGMVALYSPAAVAALAAAVTSPEIVFVPASMLAIHFSKRVLESLFVHQYSGSMSVDSVVPICTSYLFFTSLILYSQSLTEGTPPPPLDLQPVGVFLFVVGILGNFYHHFLLSKLRKEGESAYKIPAGGLFGLVTCPHYLFEILTFMGIACASQTVHSFSVMAGTMFYLMGRSWATRLWYISKFPDYPRDTKALIPFIF